MDMSGSNVRYGAELRKRARATDETRRATYACPKCSKEAVRRAGSNSIWECRSCSAVFAGGTYTLSTPAGEVASRLIADLVKREKAAKLVKA